MPALYLTEADVAELVTITDAITAVDECFADWSDPGTGNIARRRARLPTGVFHLMGAGYGRREVYGLKAYFAGPAGARYHVLLYSAKSGELLAMIEADLFGQLRTGAASGVATRLLARPNAETLAVIGSGKQAHAQAAAIAAVRPIRRIRVYSRSADKRTAFAQVLEKDLEIEARPTESGEQCVAGADVVITITKSAEPVCRAAWLAPGAHVNAAGANAATRRELDDDTVLAAALRVTDSLAQAREEAGEFRDLVDAGRLAWSDVHELGELVAGTIAGRTSPHELTLFKSLGIGLEDVAFADVVYRRALAAGAGRPF